VTGASLAQPGLCTVVDGAGSGDAVPFTRATAEGLLAAGGFFWLDLHGPRPEDFAVLRDVFGFHPLAVEDSEHFGQRSKIEDYDGFTFLSVYGAGHDADGLVEVHCFAAARFLVTVHRDDCPAFADVRRRHVLRHDLVDDPAQVLYRIVSALVDSFFPVLEELDDRIDVLEDELFLKAEEEHLQEIFRLKRRLVGMRKALTPQRDAFAAVAAGVVVLPGLTVEHERHFRDVYDHLIRICDLVDSYRDLLTGAMDVYLSMVSNRVNAVMKQLTVIATIFLPLTWLTGFFGQNFGWLVESVGGWPEFVGVGIGLELVALTVLLFFFKRRGWF
jgi:magnesium transporter